MQFPEPSLSDEFGRQCLFNGDQHVERVPGLGDIVDTDRKITDALARKSRGKDHRKKRHRIFTSHTRSIPSMTPGSLISAKIIAKFRPQISIVASAASALSHSIVSDSPFVKQLCREAA